LNQTKTKAENEERNDFSLKSKSNILKLLWLRHVVDGTKLVVVET